MTPNAHFTKAEHVNLFIRDLKPHPEVQRKFDVGWAKKIRDEFDPDKFGEIAVVRVSGECLVFDGQHRLWGARECLGENQKVPCIVYADMSTARQGELFLGRSTSKVVRALDKFKIAVIAERPIEVAITEILHRAGLKIGEQHLGAMVRSPAALLSVYTKCGDQILRRALAVIKSAWDRDPDAYDGIIIRGIAQLLYQFSAEIDDSELSRKLSRSGGPSRMVGGARDHAKAIGCSVERAITERMLNVYNKGRRTKELTFAAAKKSAPVPRAPRSTHAHAQVH